MVFFFSLFFIKLDKSITEFIWNGRVPRLRKELLQRPKTLWGLALPNLRFYYWASILRVIQLWISLEGTPVPPAWLRMEMFSAKPASLTALIHPFSVWSDCGIRAFRDMFISGIFASFQQLSEKYHLPKQHFFLDIFKCVVSSAIIAPISPVSRRPL